MKKFLLIAVAAFGMLMTACSKDEVAQPVVGGEESVVTFTVEAPVMATRAHGDGYSATELNWAVYDRNADEGSEPLFTDSKNFDQDQLTTTVKIPFVNGMTYDVLFWAEAPGTESPYAVDWAAKTVGYADATKLVSNSEDYDAFYYFLTGDELPEITGPVTKTVELKRPFAQLNIKTNDADKAEQSDVVVKNVQVVVKNGYTAFDFVYGNGINQGAVTFGSFAKLGDTTLATNYLFTGGEKSLVDVEFSYTDENEKVSDEGRTMEFAAVPVQRNYRTNIVGSLLTSEGNFNIVTLPGFDGTETFDAPSEWDGVSTETPAADANGVIRINSAEEFVGLMEVTGNSIFIGKTILLELDIDLKGNAIKGIGGDSNFAGVFDGQGHTVSNFTLDATHRSYYAGLFNQVSHGGTIKNLTVKNATIKGKSMVGAVASSLDSNATVENCKAIGCTLIGVKKVGSVVGYSAGSTVKGNYAENCTIVFSEKEAGEVLGYENTGSTVEGNTFENIVFMPSAAALAKEMTPDANGVINISRDYTISGDWTSLKYSGEITINGNGHTLKGLNKPLLVGNAAAKLTINDLTIANSEIGVAANENGLGTGAFLCFIDAYGSAAFNNCHLVASTVTGNERAGGLLGYTSGENLSIKNCTVVDCEIKAVGGAAGLVCHTDALTEVKDSSVENITVEATEDRTGKAALAGAVIGTVNGNTIFNNVTAIGNTVKNYGAVGYSEMIGRINGKLTIDGQTCVAPGVTMNADGSVYTVSTGAGFKYLATVVLADGSKNITAELANDIDLAGIEWPAVKTSAAFVLDGKDHAIKNLTTSAVEDHGFYSTALFTSTRKATTIKNLVVENAAITGKGGDNSHGAFLVACNYADLTISGVTVKNSRISNCDRTGGLVTYLYFKTANVENCVVEGCTINSIGTAGAVLGMNNGHNFTMKGCNVVNTTVSSSEGNIKAGIFIGTWQNAGTLTSENNTHSGSKAINAGVETNNEIGRHA